MGRITDKIQQFIDQMARKKYKTKISYLSVGQHSKRAAGGKSASRLEMAAKNSPRARAGLKRGSRKVKNLKEKLKKVGLIFLGIFLLAGVVGSIAFIAYLQKLDSELPPVDNPFGDKDIASIIYDRNGVELYKMFDEYNRDPVKIEDIPPHVQWAFLAAEDVDFYNHRGFDIMGIGRCAFRNITSGSLFCGGSTITQQMIKITLDLQKDGKVERKLKELLMATKVEQAYTKQEILQMYLTVAPFGSNIYGITAASRAYFAKEPKDLTLAEASILAAIIQSPVQRAPVSDAGKERAKNRQLYVLDQFRNHMNKINSQHRTNINDNEAEDLITAEMIEAAKEEELNYKSVVSNIKAGHFVDYTVSLLQQRNYKDGEQPFTISELQTGGYRIYTTLDYDLQQYSEQTVRDAIASQGPVHGMSNAALVTMKPSTGEVYAMVGSKSYFGESEGCDANKQNCRFDPKVNVLTTRQSPGSSTKPHGYYAAYRDGVLFPGSVLPDIPISIPGSGYNPQNWNDRFEGVHMGSYAANMLATSRNLPALIVMELIGTENFLQVMRDFGYTTYQNSSEFGPSAILGGADVIPIEHAQGYSVFANGGDFVRVEVISKIVDREGNTVYEYKNPERKRVADEKAIYLTNQSLNNNYNMSWDRRDLANKTGTSENHKDIWLGVWTPEFVSVAWMGNNNNIPMGRNAFGSTAVLPWMRNYTRHVGGLSGFNNKTAFTRPGGIIRGGGCSGSCEGEITGLVSHYMIEGKIPAVDNIRAKVLVCTDQPDHLARQIDINMGKARENVAIRWILPKENLQTQLDDYIRRQFGVDNKIPDEYCTVVRNSGQNGPYFVSANVTGGENINITGNVYTTNTSIASLKAFVDTNSDGTGGISLGGDIAVAASGSFSQVFLPPANTVLEPGRYRVAIIATDNAGATKVQTFDNIVIGSEASARITLLGPTNLAWGTTIGNGTSTSITLNYTGVGGPGAVNSAELFVQKNNGSYASLGNMTNAPGFSKTWGGDIANPGAGNTDSYKFYVVVRTLRNTGVSRSVIPVLTVQVAGS